MGFELDTSALACKFSSSADEVTQRQDECAIHLTSEWDERKLLHVTVGFSKLAPTLETRSLV